MDMSARFGNYDIALVKGKPTLQCNVPGEDCRFSNGKHYLARKAGKGLPGY
jgi:hypothetical protein